ncbi:carotenoid 1,2-hydratase [Hydrogenophaga sp.]|uniref:lipocalin-like domain-containing protein n=1 Tax=Hydrogenophaga sp. TaxID=1904254 RepID=UPI0027238436|nr:carotenoid 1,2-hydratase [Hydrogenophaga sp.]MDO8903008.1 carotenoid 1,2-hydratase [Hydrogenophaga sp.]
MTTLPSRPTIADAAWIDRRRWLLGTAAALALPGARAQTPPHQPGDVLQPRALVFPRDHGSHNESRTEWWYLTGHGKDAQGRAFGYQITFFRSRVDEAQSLQSRLAARQLLFAHAAITDVQEAKLWHDDRIARWNGLPPTQTERGVFASESDMQVVLRDWSFQRLADGRYRSRIEGRDISIDLTGTPTQALLLQGEQGFSRKGPEQAQSSFYVTHPQLAVRAALTVRSQRFDVQGTAWLDHEWSEAVLAPDAVGWDWIGMNLFNGDSLTAFQLRRQDGSALWSGGSFRSAADAADPLGGQRFAADAVRFEPLRNWTSPLTRATYPVAWTVTTPAGRFTVQAVIDPQELDSRQSTGTIYWEGLSDLLDSQGRLVGRGYLEMTGYATRLVL